MTLNALRAPSGLGWNDAGMHDVDGRPLGDGRRIARVAGDTCQTE